MVESSTRSTREIFGNFMPKPAGLGSIKALAELGTVLRNDGLEVLALDAGLPDHKRPEKVKERLREYADLDHDDYARYPRLPGQISEATVLPYVAEYHKAVVGLDRTIRNFTLTEGSTPALDILITMMALEKARQDKKALGEACCLETFELSYPLYPIPSDDVAMSHTGTIKIRTELDIQDGEVIQPKPWQLDRQSVTDSFEYQRNNFDVSVFTFSSPANPTGYQPSNDETDFMAQEVLKDYILRKGAGKAAKLVIEDIAYITMVHDDNAKPYTLAHAFEKMISEEAAKGESADTELLTNMKEAMRTIVTVHSLSKAAAEAGGRVAYSEGDEKIISQIREVYTRRMLSYANAGLYAALGAFEAGAPDREVMQEYSRRVKALENGMNETYFSLIEREDLAMTVGGIKETMPFPAISSGSFFTVMNLKPLVGQEVSEEFVARVRGFIEQIDNEGMKNSFGEIFKGGKINEKDLPLYFMMKTLEHGGTAVTCVPLYDGMVRFTVGITKIDEVEKAVASAREFLLNDPAYLRGVKEMAEKEQQKASAPSAEVTDARVFKIQSGRARSAA